VFCKLPPRLFYSQTFSKRSFSLSFFMHGSEYASWCLQHPLLSGRTHQDTNWSSRSYWMCNPYCFLANVGLIIVRLRSRSRVCSCREFNIFVLTFVRINFPSAWLSSSSLAGILFRQEEDRGGAGGPATCEILLHNTYQAFRRRCQGVCCVTTGWRVCRG
jgi:hypothetical protein